MPEENRPDEKAGKPGPTSKTFAGPGSAIDGPDRWTEEYAPPPEVEFPIASEVVDDWMNILLTKRLIVLRGADSRTLNAAEHTIAGRFQQEKTQATVRTAILPRSATASRKFLGDRAGQDSDNTCAIEDLCGDWPPNDVMLVTAASYETSLAPALLASLPSHARELERIRRLLAGANRFLVVLTTAELFKPTRAQREMLEFCGIVDFLRPRLAKLDPHQHLETDLLSHRTAGFWPRQTSAEVPALDQSFCDAVVDALRGGILEKLIELGREVMNSGVKDVRAEYKKRAEAIVRRSDERQYNWPDQNDFLGQVLLFAVAFFKLPTQEYDHVIRELLGDDRRTMPIAVRTLMRPDGETVVRLHRPTRLTDCWAESRNSLLERWGLQGSGQSNVQSITTLDDEDRELIVNRFATRYPFTYVDLWQRMLQRGFLFDESDVVADGFKELLVTRISEDPDSFGQRFLGDLLSSPQAIGFEAEGADLSERFDKLQELGTLNLILYRLSAAFIAILDNDPRDLVPHSIEQLVDWGVPGIAVRLLRRLSGHSQFSIAKRLKLAMRILDNSARENWDDACALLRLWIENPSDSWETIKAITDKLPAQGADPSGQATAAAAALMGAVNGWFRGPTPEKHRLLEILAISGNDGIPALVMWLFNPALERARIEQPQVAFLGYWLLAAHTRGASNADRVVLASIQIEFYERFHASLKPLLTSGARNVEMDDIPLVREFQAAVIADWIAALPEESRPQLFQALAERVSDDVRRELFVIWRAIDEAARIDDSLRGAVPGLSDRSNATLLRSIAPELLEGRKIFRHITTNWVTPAKPANQDGGEKQR